MEKNDDINSIKWCKKCKDPNYHSKFHIGCNIARKIRNKKANNNK